MNAPLFVTTDGSSRLFVKSTNIEGIYKYGAEQLCDRLKIY